jgi:hypothetical protein
MNDEYLTGLDFKNLGSYYKMLGIDVNSEIMKHINAELKDSSDDEWFAKQMDHCFTDALKDGINTSNFEKYKYVLIG